MVRIFILSLILCLTQSFVHGQDAFFKREDRNFYGGFTIGANFCEVIGDAYHGYHKVGLNAGALVVGRISEEFGASLELLYSQKGSRGVREINSNYSGAMFEKYYLDLNYVEVPFQLHFFSGRRTIVGTGISYSRLLKSSESLSTDQPVYLNPKEHEFNKDDIAVVFSGGLGFFDHWMISLRYQYSLKPVREWDKVPVKLGSGNQTNTYFTVRLIYFIP